MFRMKVSGAASAVLVGVPLVTTQIAMAEEEPEASPLGGVGLVSEPPVMSEQPPITGIDEVGSRSVLASDSDGVRRELAERYTSYGRDVSADHVYIYEVERGNQVEYIASTDPVENESITFGVTTALTFVRPSTPDSGGASVAAASWSSNPPTCFTRLDGFDAWMDACSQRLKLADDTDKSYDWHGIRAFATTNNASSARMATGRSECCPFAFDAWADWSPRSDREASCEQITYGFSYQASVSWNVQACEEWVITKGEDPAVFGVGWSGNGGNEGNREIAFAIAGQVNEGEAYRQALLCSLYNTWWADAPDPDVPIRQVSTCVQI